jgi:O-antigen ligase
MEYVGNPMIGVGAGNYPYRVADYETAEFVQRADIWNRSLAGRSVHSSYFQLLAELGTLGLIVFVLMMVHVLRQGLKIGRNTKEADTVAVQLAQATAAAMCAFLAAGAFLSALYYPHFWLVCAMSGSVPALMRKPGEPVSEPTPPLRRGTGRPRRTA